MKILEIKFEASKSAGDVSGLALMPESPRAALVFAHGAGAGMRHPFMAAASERLAENGIATLRYQFPYMEKKSKRPDPKPILYATVRAAVHRALELFPNTPLFAGGKSMGGRMTSAACAEKSIAEIRGLVFFGFPLHPAGKPSIERAEHLKHVRIAMLFLQGSADKLAEPDLLRPVCSELGERADLRIFERADHSFHVPKSSGQTDAEVLQKIVDAAADWMIRIASN